jgi:hypothetical protein
LSLVAGDLEVGEDTSVIGHHLRPTRGGAQQPRKVPPPTGGGIVRTPKLGHGQRGEGPLVEGPRRPPERDAAT